jgi:hypothetical protein
MELFFNLTIQLHHDVVKNLHSILCQVHGEEVEEKTRSWRQNKKLKIRQGDEGKQDQDQEPSQEDGRDRPQDLGFIHPTSQPKPRITLNYFCLSVRQFLEIPPSFLIRHSLHPYQANIMPNPLSKYH